MRLFIITLCLLLLLTGMTYYISHQGGYINAFLTGLYVLSRGVLAILYIAETRRDQS